jgi:Purple acid Phosphatase, N-terminal domain
MTMGTLLSVATILVIFKSTMSAFPISNRPRTVTQVHLAQGITSASMTVSWVTPSSIPSTSSPSLKPAALKPTRDIKSHSFSNRQRQDRFGEKSLTSKRVAFDAKQQLEQDYSNEVRYSTVPSNMYLSAVGYSTSYKFNYRKLENYTSGILHHTLLTNLLPSTIYYYRCGDFNTGSDHDVSGNE